MLQGDPIENKGVTGGTPKRDSSHQEMLPLPPVLFKSEQSLVQFTCEHDLPHPVP